MERKRKREKVVNCSSAAPSLLPSVPPSLRLFLSPSELREKKLLVKYITQNLEAVYGVPVNESPYDPLSELIRQPT
jgi:hypothetical protein